MSKASYLEKIGITPGSYYWDDYCSVDELKHGFPYYCVDAIEPHLDWRGKHFIYQNDEYYPPVLYRLMSFDRYIKLLREKLSLSKQEAAHKIGVSKLCINNWERIVGYNSIPTLKSLEKIIAAYGHEDKIRRIWKHSYDERKDWNDRMREAKRLIKKRIKMREQKSKL